MREIKRRTSEGWNRGGWEGGGLVERKRGNRKRNKEMKRERKEVKKHSEEKQTKKSGRVERYRK